MNISYYGGSSTIVPLPLSVFMKMIEESYKSTYTPEPKHIQHFFESSNQLANTTNNEVEWFKGVTQMALKWLIGI